MSATPESPAVLTTPNIHTAIINAMKKVGYVQKQSGDTLNYTYASERALVAALRPAMLEEGIFLYPLESHLEYRGDFLNKHQTRIVEVVLHIKFRFVHAPSNTFLDVAVFGSAMDTGDKAENKAMTVGLKYALRQTMLIETGDDPDSTASEQYETRSAQTEGGATTTTTTKQQPAKTTQKAPPKDENGLAGKAALDMYYVLCSQAKKANIEFTVANKGILVKDLRALYSELSTKIKTAAGSQVS